MTIRVLWPRSCGRNHDVEIEALGDGFTAEFCRGVDQVTDEQWNNCEGIVGVAPPAEYLDRLHKCRIVVKMAVGFRRNGTSSAGAKRAFPSATRRTTAPGKWPTTPSP